MNSKSLRGMIDFHNIFMLGGLQFRFQARLGGKSRQFTCLIENSFFRQVQNYHTEYVPSYV